METQRPAWNEYVDIEFDQLQSDAQEGNAYFSIVAKDKDLMSSDFLGQTNNISTIWLLKNLDDQNTKKQSSLFGDNTYYLVGSVEYSATRIFINDYGEA